jgi:hypothetical protein
MAPEPRRPQIPLGPWQHPVFDTRVSGERLLSPVADGEQKNPQGFFQFANARKQLVIEPGDPSNGLMLVNQAIHD